MKRTIRARIFLLALPIFLLACNAVTATPTPTAMATANATITQPTPMPMSIPTLLPAPITGSRIERDVTYCTTNGIALKMDLYLPGRSTTKLAPVAVNIHGGSWSFGDKAMSENQPEIDALVARGYIVAAVNYRLAPAYKFPAQIEDVKCALRFLRAHAADYALDPNHIGAFGCSAGGHLAAMLGVTDASTGFERGNYLDQSSRVQAVVTISAAFDLALVDLKNAERARTMQRVFGATIPNDPIFTRASPLHFVSQDDPPFLILQADNDPLVPLIQPTRFYERLRGVGIPATLIVAQNAVHCLPPSDAMYPRRAQLTESIISFFDHTLR